MKARLIKRKNEMLLLCQDGTIKKADRLVLESLLTCFTQAKNFTGKDGVWFDSHSFMNEVKGETLAFIEDNGMLVVLSEETFKSVLSCGEYISVSEYAKKHHKSRAQIKKLCGDNRLSGAYKTSSGWLIPSNAPYPERKERTTKPK